jgi:hypothetical protein
MSASPPIASKHWHRSETPLCANRVLTHRSEEASLFDRLIGEREQPVGNLEAERLRGLEVDD